jgi:multicomponent Na+:H+ antiporter subunit C
MNEALLFIMFIIGLGLIVIDPNIIKKVIGLGIMNNAVVLLFVLRGSLIGKEAAILVSGAEKVVDPIPQALMLTAIVIGVCITALALGFAYNLYRKYGTFDIDSLKEKAEHEIR